MKKLLLSLCAILGLCSGAAAFDKNDEGRSMLYVYAENDSQSELLTSVLPLKYDGEPTPETYVTKMMETEPGSNVFILTSSPTLFGPNGQMSFSMSVTKIYIFTELFEDAASFDKNKNLLGMPAGTVVPAETPWVVSGEYASSEAGQNVAPFYVPEGVEPVSSFFLIIDMNQGKYAFDYQYGSFMVEKENPVTYFSPKEDLIAARAFKVSGAFTSPSNAFDAPRGEKKFRIQYNLSPFEPYLRVIAPERDLTFEFDDNGVAVNEDIKVNDFYCIYPSTPDFEGNQEAYRNSGWFILPDRAGHKLCAIYCTADLSGAYSKDLTAIKIIDYSALKKLYINNSDEVFDWQGYKTPTIDKKDGWTNVLEAVEGKPGLFRGKIKMGYKPEWNYLGVKIFDRFAKSDDAKDQSYSSSISTSESQMEEDGFIRLDYVWWSSVPDLRLGFVWYNNIPEEFEIEINLTEGRCSLYVDPENYYTFTPEYTESKAIHLIGNCEGWNTDCPQEWWLGKKGDNVYERTFLMPADSEFRFYTQLRTWDAAYSIGADWDDFTSVEVALPHNGNVCIGGMGSWRFYGFEGGYVTFRVDLDSRTVSMTPADGIPDGEPSDFAAAEPLEEVWETLSINGSFGKHSLEKIDDYKFKGKVVIPPGVQTFNFVSDDAVETPFIGANIENRDVLSEEAIGGRIITSRRSAIPGKSYKWRTNADYPGGMVNIIVDKLNHKIQLVADTSNMGGIEQIDAEQGAKVIYNLQGIRVDESRLIPGIYIVNGKKVVIR